MGNAQNQQGMVLPGQTAGRPWQSTRPIRSVQKQRPIRETVVYKPQKALSVSVTEIFRCLSRRQLLGMTGTYRQNKDRYTALSGFARFLKYEGQMDEEEYLKLKALHPIRSPYNPTKQRIITADEVGVIVQESNICLLLSETALRISEFSALTPDCLHYSGDPTRAFIEVRCGKGGKGRIVPFSKRAQGCRWDMGKSQYWWGKHIRAVSLKTGIDFSAHSLRHWRVWQ